MSTFQLRLRRLLRATTLSIGTILGVVLAWAIGFLWFVTSIPDRVADTTTHTDAIVVLTGGRDRLETGLQLLEDGLGDQLFVSGVHKDVDIAEIMKVGHADRPDIACCIALGYAAPDTVGNADETAAWAIARGMHSIRLVTGAYHMPRSLLEFQRSLPGARILPHPVFPGTVKSREWWRWPGTAALLATEYSKYLAAIVRHWFLPRKGFDR